MAKFQKGQSGNPKGRPRTGHSLAEAIRTHVDPEALVNRVVGIAMFSHDERMSIAAANWLAANGWIKPPTLQARAVTTVNATAQLPAAWATMTLEQRAGYLAQLAPAPVTEADGEWSGSSGWGEGAIDTDGEEVEP